MHKRAVQALVVFGLLAGWSPLPAEWMGAGCWYCEDGGLTGVTNRYCTMAGHGEYGEGLDCQETHDGIGYTCYIPPNPCYNENAGGGGGGTAGGGGGSTCLIRVGRLCPAQCFSCEYVYI